MPSTLEKNRPATGRDPWFDNAKMLLVTFVVAGHSWVLLPEGSLAREWAYDFLYLWHMPAFVMVTGHLSRSFTWSRRNLERLATTVVLPYLVFETLLAAFRVRVGGEDPFDTLLIEPHWPMWFLAALFFWRLATPLLQRLPAVLALAVAVAVSLLGGLLPGDVLDVGRTTGMLPFFVLGLVARPEHLGALRSPAARWAGAAVLALGVLVAPFLDGRLRTEWLYWRSGYAEIGVSLADGLVVRALLLVAAIVLALGALALVPRTTTWFTGLGAATMVVYLFHGFAIKAAGYTGVLAWSHDHPWLGLVAATVASVALAVALAWSPVARRLNVLVDPVGAYRRQGTAADAAHDTDLLEARSAPRRPVSYLPL